MNEEELYHYGTPRHSGRYPWGSGDTPYQRNLTFLSLYRDLKAQGKTDSQIAEYLRKNVAGYEHVSSADVKARNSIATAEERAANITRAQRLFEHGYSKVRIADMMGTNESTVRGWLKASEETQKTRLDNTAELLKRECDKKGYIDIGSAVEYEIGVTRTNLDTAAAMLKEKGYQIYRLSVPQANNPTNKTTMLVLGKPGTEWKEVYFNTDLIQPITEYTADGGKTFTKTEFPSSVDPNRVMVRYAEEGGINKDGVMEIRRGVTDVSLGDSNYAQVRIAVNNSHYLKGMAMYGEDKDFPPGVDIIFNTNKHVGTPMLGEKDNTVLKPLKRNKETGAIDEELPFGAVIKAGGQSYYSDKNGKYVKEGDSYRLATKDDKDAAKYSLSPVNKLKEEGDWDSWSKTLSAQFLSKQNGDLIVRQLNLTYANKKAEFDEIMSLENPVIKKKLLESFADDCDSSSVNLKAASLPGQSSKVILPLTSITDTQVYAPTYKDGTQVALIRYPHAGTFEIPVLTVNNSDKTANALIGNTAKDAIGIHPRVAERLSGADFDGDSVVVIPINSKVKVTSTKPLEGLEGFDPKEAYRGYEGMKRMTASEKGLQMGMVSNLITDMTIQGATREELTRAVKHSMVVIDAEKHGLNWKQSEQDNAIQALKDKYQPKDDPTKPGGGASTLISKSKASKIVDERKRGWKPNEDGEYDWTETERIYKDPVKKKVPILDKDGNPTGRTKTEYVRDTEGNIITKDKVAKQRTTWMEDTKDARTLISSYDSWQEKLYADYANKVKSLAAEARREAGKTGGIDYDKKAAEVYKYEVDQLKSALNVALKNAPRERRAQAISNAVVQRERRKYREMGDELDTDKEKKLRQQSIANARAQVGAGKTLVEITDKQWDAIQAGAVNTTTLLKIMNNTDMDKLKQRATPRNASTTVTEAKAARMKAMQSSGYTIAEIAEALNLSTSTVSKNLKSA